jgi:predicted enzyme related to lactoylglutathione lyase
MGPFGLELRCQKIVVSYRSRSLTAFRHTSDAANSSGVTRERSTHVNQGVKTILYPVKDVAAAKAVFTTLIGAEPYADQPYYVGYKVGDQDIGLVPNGHSQGMTGPISYHHIDDIKATIQSLVQAGAKTQQEPRDVGGGRLVATLTDADGNVIGLIQG